MNILETRGLTKQFGRLTAVREVDLSVAAGERHAIIGPNGAGKTTLFHLVTGGLRPSAGTVRFQNTDITRLAPHQIGVLGLARSFQITNIFARLSVRENIRLAVQARHRRRETWWGGRSVIRDTADRAATLLEQLQLASVADASADTLSYGDQRRLEIGLAIAASPVFLLLDEPTAGMSRAEAREVVDFLRHIPRDVTILLIEHDIDVVSRLSDRVTVMHLGAILTQGTPEDVQRDDRVREAYFGGEIDVGDWASR